jgi:hypothetical protein
MTPRENRPLTVARLAERFGVNEGGPCCGCVDSMR